MNSIDKNYINLLKDILENGVSKGDRTGTGTISVFGRQIRHKMSEGFPLLTTKKMFFRGIITELFWFLRGETNIQSLVKEGNNIWVGDAYKRYYDDWLSRKNNEWGLTKEEFINKIKTDDEFAEEWGELGPIYGAQWRKWERYGYRNVQNGALDCGMITMEEYQKEMYIDQIANLINDLKTNPDSRRLMVNAWNVGELDKMTLPPCHYGFQLWTRELSDSERAKIYWDKKGIGNPMLPALRKDIDDSDVPTRAISLMWNQRSVDTPLGLPFNIASYAALLMIFAKMTNMVPDELIGNLGDTHVYNNQIDGVKEQINRNGYDELPNLKISDSVNFKGSIDDMLASCTYKDFTIENYKSEERIEFPLSN